MSYMYTWLSKEAKCSSGSVVPSKRILGAFTFDGISVAKMQSSKGEALYELRGLS